MPEAKAKILEAASAIFLKDGLSGLSVRAIAAQAGVSTIGIYSYFKGKQGVLDTLYVDGFERLHDAMDVFGEGASPREEILIACRNYLRIGDQYQAHYRLMFGEESKGFSPSPEALKSASKAFALVLAHSAAVLPKGSEKNTIQEFAFGVWSVLHGYTGLRHHMISQVIRLEDLEHTILQVVECYIDGFKSRL